MKIKRFQKFIEDFNCLNCGAFVKGNGFTNHCPECLWSLHVDINPGDRANTCKGLMEPIGTELKHGKTIIVHCCVICKLIKKNKAAILDKLC